MRRAIALGIFLCAFTVASEAAQRSGFGRARAGPGIRSGFSGGFHRGFSGGHGRFGGFRGGFRGGFHRGFRSGFRHYGFGFRGGAHYYRGFRSFGFGFYGRPYAFGGFYSSGVPYYVGGYSSWYPGDYLYAPPPPPVVVYRYERRIERDEEARSSGYVALTDGTVERAIAAWTDEAELHYVTTSGKRVSVGIDQFDRARTERLNERTGFRVPAARP